MREQLQLQIDESDDARVLWERTLETAARRLGRQVVESWLQDTRPLGLQDGVLTIGAPNGTHRDWVEKKYSAELAEIAGQAHGRDLTVQVVVKSDVAAAPESRNGARGTGAVREPSLRREPAERIGDSSSHFPPTPLNDKYTFENFVVGASNRFAHAAAMAVAN